MSKPVLVLLHGFLGAASDWQPLQIQLPDVHCVPLDLPGHGSSQDTPLCHMTDFPAWLQQQLTLREIRHYHLLGYSLGGRLALQFAATQPAGLQSLLLENAHPGLMSAMERQLRINTDAQWARRFYRQPLAEVLTDWYQQPVFADLSADERQQLIQTRANNDARALARALCRYSLARQADFRFWIKTTSTPVLYLCGTEDSKFQAIGNALQGTAPRLQLALLPGGHNLHRATPDRMAQIIRHWLKPFSGH